MRNKNKTDRETSKPVIVLNPSNQAKKRIIHSPGSDKVNGIIYLFLTKLLVFKMSIAISSNNCRN
jgi:hypothetical protein